MMRLIDLTYHKHEVYESLSGILKWHTASHGYLKYMQGLANVTVVKHLKSHETEIVDGVPCVGFKGYNSFFHIPYKAHRYIKSIHPDVVVVQGLSFPLQVIMLRLALGRSVKIVVQHHGESPFVNRFKRHFQRIADGYIDAYIFTSKGNADKWIDAGIIKHADKCYEVLEASTNIRGLDKDTSKTKLNIKDDNVFLWVGRLNSNKDPLTVLEAFNSFLANNTAHLYMIYQDDSMLAEVTGYIESSHRLRANVTMVGKVLHEELVYWYSAADFFISGSHREGSGYALIECMACGCIPVVTDIPPFRKITDNGRLGLLYAVGDAVGLTHMLEQAMAINKVELQREILEYFSDRLSFKAIAADMYAVCEKLMNAK